MELVMACMATAENGQLNQATVMVLSGLIGLAIVVSIALGLVVQARALKKSACDEKEVAIARAREEARKETASEIALRDLRMAIEDMDKTLSAIQAAVNSRVDRIENVIAEHTSKLAEVDAASRSAHKRLDEHKSIDHNGGAKQRRIPIRESEE